MFLPPVLGPDPLFSDAAKAVAAFRLQPGERVWIAPPPFKCRRSHDMGTVVFAKPGHVEVRWDRCGLLMHLDYINRPMDLIRPVYRKVNNA